jgi:hypothetical protein
MARGMPCRSKFRNGIGTSQKRYLPRQNWLKIESSKSSVVVLPTISPTACAARRRSSATSSKPEIGAQRRQRAFRRLAPAPQGVLVPGVDHDLQHFGRNPADQTVLLDGVFQFSMPAPVKQQTSIAASPSGNCRRRGKSALLRTSSLFRPANSVNNCLSNSPAGSEPSKTCRINSAVASVVRLRRTPSASISSAASRKPAVSIKTTGTPRTLAVSSMVSRVVPGMGRDDGALLAQELVEQAGFADVGAANDRGPNAAPQQSALRWPCAAVHP